MKKCAQPTFSGTLAIYLLDVMKTAKFFVLPDREYSGLSLCVMSVGRTDFVFRVSKDPLFFECEAKLAQVLKGKEDYIKAELSRSPTIESFCQKILHFVTKLVSTSALVPSSQPPSQFFRRILEEIRDIGWECVTKVDPTLSFFEVAFPDSKGRRIEIRFDISPTFPRTPPKVTGNLPGEVTFEWNPQTSKLLDILHKYREITPSFDAFWEELECIDRDGYVIEPQEPSLSCCMRRIVLTSQVQIQIEVNPRKPRNVPKISFLGAELPSRELREVFNKNIRKWDFHVGLKENLQNALELELPKPEADEFKETDFECGICYLERFGSELPEIVCGRCSKRFHRSCLIDWLRTRPDAEQSFQVVFGPCPYCNEQIQCTVTAV